MPTIVDNQRVPIGLNPAQRNKVLSESSSTYGHDTPYSRVITDKSVRFLYGSNFRFDEGGTVSLEPSSPSRTPVAPSTGDLYTASSDVTFRTPLGSSWSPSDTSYLSIASPVGSRERRDGGVSPPVQRIRIDSLVGGDPVDTNADAEEETWLRKSAAEVKVMAARIDGLQREIRELRKELEESRTKILDMEERQEAFWQEDVYDIVNNISSVSSTPPFFGVKPLP
ncbi:hypothetical protein FOZ60_012667 [Perkinsus olseni]|uniref:Uncharacterized protein n=1 Tax=Perkinsus olseni TaxID=32597 RepID=A0A7J6P9B4_PEROL|nr:hypothetical protein FOZ60_012667 [Perkinsus olseni]